MFDLRRKEEDAALKLKNVEESLKKTISEQRDEITKYLTVSTEKERVITEKTTEVEKIKKESEDLKEKMGKINVDNKLLKEQYKELESFRLWTRKIMQPFLILGNIVTQMINLLPHLKQMFNLK